MIRRWRRLRRKDVAELNITAFMNLMVVLVPFLLITAVFSRMAILQLNLPSPTAAVLAEDDRFELIVTVRAKGIEVMDSRGQPLQNLPRGSAGLDFAALNRLAQSLKTRHPDAAAATVLLEPDTDYDTLVQVMDAIRAGRGPEPQPLFTEIAVGDADPGH
jgi:biopolymer transport protein ExbD